MKTVIALLAAISFPALSASAPEPHTPDRVGIEAATASSRQPGGYNNYCQTWRDSRAKDRALFGACLAND